MDILNSREVKQIRKMLLEQFGVEEKLDYVYLKKGEKIYITNRSLDEIDFRRLRINTIGMYFGEVVRGKLRLSVSGSQLVGPLAKMGVFELNEEQVRGYFNGEKLEVGELDIGNGDFIILKFKDDFIVTGQYKNGVILNYLNKSYRTKDLIV